MKTSAELQRQSLVRKLTYFGLILFLFTAMTLSGSVVRSATGGRLQGWSVSEQAERLQLREISQGQANVLGSTIQVSLTGSRGFAICVLWMSAIEKQKHHEWNELKLLVNVITKLQPHFLTPWLFQSWNLAYNVSVESDRVRDKYFYISEGISLLAQGERINRGRGVEPDGREYIVGNPDMRFWLGFYYMNKFGASDEQNALRSLLQLSCIDPAKRNPKAMRGEGGRADPARFREFVRENPYLCRRLRDYLRCTRPEDVLDYLADNEKLPSRYEEIDGTFQLRRRTEDQFPVLPDSPRTSDRVPARGVLTGEFDNFHAGWAWMEFAQEPLPPYERGRAAAGVPAYDPLRYRMARSPMSILFRQYPARCQSYIAERLQREGWFNDQGWMVDEGHVTDTWFPAERVVAGNDRRYSSQEAWARAYQMWRRHGEDHGLSFEQSKIDSLDARARVYRRTYQVEKFMAGPDISPDKVTQEVWESFDAHRQLLYHFQNLQVTNFPHFLYCAQAESDLAISEIRRLLFVAEEARKAGNVELSLRTYVQAFKQLCGDPLSGRRGALEDYPKFRNDESIQEDLYEKNINYLLQLEKHRGRDIRILFGEANLLANATRLGLAFDPAGWLYLTYAKPAELPMLFSGLLDGHDSTGRPWCAAVNAMSVKVRMGLIKPEISAGADGTPGEAVPAPTSRGGR